VKSRKRGDLLSNLEETFGNLRKFRMMLNPKKCVFGVSSEKLLGYMVSSRGIDANPKKVEAIDKLQPLRTRKEIQKLAGMMMRCISKDEDIQLLRDIHNGVCGVHSSWRSIVGKTFRQDLYKMMRCRSSPNAEIVNSSRSKPRSMRILFDPLIYLGPLRYGESTLWGSSQELQEVSDSYSSELIHSPSGWRPPQW
jgi:hypothetical protein